MQADAPIEHHEAPPSWWKLSSFIPNSPSLRELFVAELRLAFDAAAGGQEMRLDASVSLKDTRIEAEIAGSRLIYAANGRLHLHPKEGDRSARYFGVLEDASDMGLFECEFRIRKAAEVRQLRLHGRRGSLRAPLTNIPADIIGDRTLKFDLPGNAIHFEDGEAIFGVHVEIIDTGWETPKPAPSAGLRPALRQSVERLLEAMFAAQPGKITRENGAAILGLKPRSRPFSRIWEEAVRQANASGIATIRDYGAAGRPPKSTQCEIAAKS